MKKYRPSIPLNEFYAHITGIEKEYRLSKVSKVSAFMYGHDETKIIYSDALIPNDDVKERTYDVLIANPPYSVKGFLDTLTETQRKQYSLFNDSLNIAKNNAIEIFFIERAAQLLKAGGVAGIILPVSVLNKGGIYTKAREIILQQFDIVALVEFGSGTFGKTGTNTITMFLRRKETNTPDAEHYRNRVDCWFCNYENCESNEIYDDIDFLKAYCDYCGFEWEDYHAFLAGSMTDKFLEHETIQAYHTSFFGNQRNAMKGVCEQAKEIRTKIISRQKTQAYKRLPEEEKKKQETKAFLQFIVAIEKEKVYYFILAKTTPNPVVIVKSPSGTTNMKRFLGYEWSDSKGNEGIKYLNVAAQNLDDDEGNGEDDDTLHQIEGIKGIQTPLFNPQNLEDRLKINTIIRSNFTNDCFVIPDELNEMVSVAPIIDMIDFTRTTFNLSINTNVSTIEDFQSKHPLVKLGNLICEEPQYGANESAINGNPQVDYRYIRITDITDDGRLNSDWKTAERVEERYILNEGDILFARSGATAGKVFYYKPEYGKALYAGYLIRFKFNPEKVLPMYVYELLSSRTYRNWIEYTRGGSAQPNINAQQFASFKIPVPPLQSGIQQALVKDCLLIDKKYQEAYSSIGIIKKRIGLLMDESQSQALRSIKLNQTDLFDISIGRRVLKSEIVNDGLYDVYSANVFEPFGKTNHSVLSDFSKPSVLWGIDGDWMVNYRDCNKPFNPTDHCGVIRVLDETIVNPRYLVYPLLKAGEIERFSRANRASTERIKALTITVPDINIQNKVAEQLAQMEGEISSLQVRMQECMLKKQEILDKYLK